MKPVIKVQTLQLRYPFGIARGVSNEAHTVLFRLGDLGQGEAAPVRYKNQSCEGAIPVLEKMAEGVDESNIDDIEFHERRALEIAPDHSSARNAFNNALWDARGRRAGKPVYELVGPGRPTLETTYTVSLADNDKMEERAREAGHLPLLKVKLGRDGETDLDAMKRIRAVAPKATLRIDANAGWSLETVLWIAPRLAELGVEFLEQPLAIGNLEDLKTLHEKSPLPIVADEDAQDMTSLPALKGRVSGINIKLTKCGGISEALRMIEFARAEGWQVMFGCMLETRLGLGAAAHLGALADCMDLDAHMLTTNDPFPPGSLREFDPALPLSDQPGLGLPLFQED
ncbi:MAG: dipeptide epimerase [Candidatus Sumerlaeia bacterium]|nr:dipeptide epimerase [Candidatus Sumerlaeia bacterium]